MASIVKRRNRRFWYASYRDLDGKQHLVSTKIQHTPNTEDPTMFKIEAGNNRRLALQHAARLEETERGNPTEAHLRKVLSDMSERLNRKRIEFPSTRDFLRKWLDRRPLSDMTRARYSGAIETFITHLGSKAELPIESISPKDLNDYAKDRLSEGRSPSTIQTDLKILNTPFNSAMREGLILTNPVAAADPIDAASEERHPFTVEEVEKLLRETQGTEWETVIHLAAFAGLRLGDAISLKWGDIDLFKGILTFRPKKTARKKRDLSIPLSERLLAYVKTLPLGESEDLITPKLASMRSSGKSGLSSSFSRIMERAKIAQSSIKSKGKGRTFNRKSFHSLRHFFITRLEAKGVAPDIRMKLAGHTSERIHGGYSHTELETLRKAVKGL